MLREAVVLAMAQEIGMRNLAPVALSVGATGLLGFGIRISKVEVVEIAPFPETAVGLALNVLMFILALLASGFAMYALIRLGFKALVKLALTASLAIAAFLIFNWYLSALSGFEPAGPSGPVHLVASAALTTLLILGVKAAKGILHMIATTLLGSIAGTFLAASLPVLTSFLLLLALVAYDLYAVYAGPVGKIAKSADLEELAGATVTYGGITMGAGDIVFYSMLTGKSLIEFGPIPFAASSFGVLLGAYMSLRMARRHGIFPGLPLSLIVGMILMAIGIHLGNVFH